MNLLSAQLNLQQSNENCHIEPQLYSVCLAATIENYPQMTAKHHTQHSFSTNKRFYMGQNIAKKLAGRIFLRRRHHGSTYDAAELIFGSFSADTENSAAAAKFGGSGVLFRCSIRTLLELTYS